MNRALVAAALAAALAAAPAAAQRYVRDTPVPPQFFGLVMHKVHTTTPWPEVRFGSWRLWDSYLKWSDVEPVAGQYRFAVFDRQVELGTRHGVEMYYTFGQTPQWASTAPSEKHAWGMGAGAMPRDIEDWKRYVSAVTSRYKGRIAAYEVWNEPKYANLLGKCKGAIFFCGSAAELVTLTRTAREIVKRNDPAALLTSPGFSAGLVGVKQLDDYLSAGADKLIDVVSFHFYELHPETAWKTVTELRNVLHRHGLDRLPIWNTEVGYLVQNQERSVKPQSEAGPFSVVYAPEAAAARMARVHLVSASGGIDRVAWYAWDSKLMGATGSNDGKINSVGRAYGVLQGWLVGATIACAPDTSLGQWRCDLQRKGRKASVFWDREVHAKTSARVRGSGKRMMETLLDGAVPVDGGAIVDWDGAPVLFTEDGKAWGTS